MAESMYDYRAPDYKVLSQGELLKLWVEHRNDPVGLMAGDEVLRRLVIAQAQQRDTPDTSRPPR